MPENIWGLGGRGAGRCATRVDVRCAYLSLRSLSLVAASARSIVGIFLNDDCKFSSSMKIGFEINTFPSLALDFEETLLRPPALLMKAQFSGSGGTVDETSAKENGLAAVKSCSWVGFPFVSDPAVIGLEMVGNVPSSFRRMFRAMSGLAANAEIDKALVPFRSS